MRRKNLRRDQTVEGLVSKLQQAKMLSGAGTKTLLSNFGHMTRKLFKNEVRNKSGLRFSDEIKEFCITLNFTAQGDIGTSEKHVAFHIHG